MKLFRETLKQVQRSMALNFVKLVIRNTLKSKVYSFLTLAGLSIGFASFFIVYLYISDELSYDRFHDKADRIYRIASVMDFEGVGEESASAPFPVAFTLLKENSDLVENAVRIFNFQLPQSLIEYAGWTSSEKGFYFADSTFFDIFTHEFIAGNPQHALDHPGSVVLKESAAKRLFGTSEVLGKKIRYEGHAELEVTGVVRDNPSGSHFNFDILASFSTVYKFYPMKEMSTWVWNPCWTYFLLRKGVKPEQLEARLPGFAESHYTEIEKGNMRLYLQKLTDIHLTSKLDYELETNGNKSNIYILSALACFLLLLSQINFINLATASSGGRAKEIGVKKVAGASRRQIIAQFLGETTLLSVVSVGFALIIIEITLPYFRNWTGKEFLMRDLLTYPTILVLILTTVGAGLVAGLYPAIYRSSFSPALVLKGAHYSQFRSGLARKILVLLQFTISITMIIITITAFRQVRFLRTTPLGFDKKNLVMLPVYQTSVANVYPVFKKELLKNPSVISVTAVDDVFGISHNTHEFLPEGYTGKKYQYYPALVVRYDFVRTFGIQIVAGRDYDESYKTDPMYGILINESMVRHLGWGSNENALGKSLMSMGGREKVIGVFRDFQATSLYNPTSPFVLNMKETPRSVHYFLKYVAIRISGENKAQTLKYIEDHWNRICTRRPFEYFFLEDKLNELYAEEANLSRLLVIFTLIILFVTGLGLTGLSLFLAEQKTKEIGIKKVLGASISQIVVDILREFLVIIAAASLLSWGVTYLIMTNWLSHFAYHTRVSFPVFLLSALIAMVMALLLTGYRAYLAARTDPVVTLKYE
jgi:putative ABC transport system permease protein